MARPHRPIVDEAWYFITSVTSRRTRWFENPALAQIVVDQWVHYRQAYGFRLDAYCVMPDHYHSVLNVGSKKSISQILHGVHSYSATLVNRALGHDKKRSIWQRRAIDVGIRTEEMYWQKVAYTLLNPWRAGLVAQALDPYPFSNLAEWIESHGEEFMLELFGKCGRKFE